MGAIAALGAEGMQHRFRTTRGDLEERPEAGCAAEEGRAVEVAVGALNEGGDGLRAIGGPAREGVDHALSSAGHDLEDGAVVAGTARLRRPIEVSIGCLYQGGFGNGSTVGRA